MTQDLISYLSTRDDLRLTASLSRNAESYAEYDYEKAPAHHVDTFDRPSGLPAALLRLPFRLRDLIKFVKSNSVEVVFAVMRHPFSPMVFAALRSCGVRVILVVHDALPHPGDYFPFWQSHFKLELRSTDAIVVMSRTVEMAMDKHYHYPRRRIFFMPLPAPLFTGSRAERVAPTSRPWRLLFFGRILRYKGLELLARAYKQLQQRFSVTLNIVGQGESPALIDLSNDPSVTIKLGWLPEDQVPSVLEDADILVLPYTEASQSGVLLSGFAVGLPAIATPVGGITEQVVPGHNGLLARAVTPEAFAAAVAELMLDHRLYARCARGAAESAVDAFSASRAGDAIVSAARAVVEMPPR